MGYFISSVASTKCLSNLRFPTWRADNITAIVINLKEPTMDSLSVTCYGQLMDMCGNNVMQQIPRKGLGIKRTLSTNDLSLTEAPLVKRYRSLPGNILNENPAY